MSEVRGTAVEHPKHYNAHPSGVEAIEICRHMGFNLGNAFKYVFRAGLKGERKEDLSKALWYVIDEYHNRLHNTIATRKHKPATGILCDTLASLCAKVIMHEPCKTTAHVYSGLFEYWFTGDDQVLSAVSSNLQTLIALES